MFQQTERHAEGREGITLCFDNINQHTSARHHSSTNRNVQLNMVQGFAALNRISTEGMDNTTPGAHTFLGVPMEAFVPSENDIILMRESIKVNCYIILLY